MNQTITYSATDANILECHLNTIQAELDLIKKFKIVPEENKKTFDELAKMKIIVEYAMDLFVKNNNISKDEVHEAKKNGIEQYNQIRTTFSPEERKLIEKFSQGEYGIITSSDSMLDVFEEIEAYKNVANVLVTGETGTGKELVAGKLHELSRRKDKKMLIVNCGAIDKNLIQGELFGWKKSGHDKAHNDRPGYFKTAHEGSIFLDEIGELPMETQPSLLRVCEKGDIQPIGSDKTEKVDVRIITATNRDLEYESQNGNFKHDLIPRIAEVKIHIPPLRERKNDIPQLCYFFFRKFYTEYIIKSDDYKIKEFPDIITDKTFVVLQECEWKYNVRDVISFTRRLVLMNANYLSELKPWMLIKLYKNEKLTIKALLRDSSDSEKQYNMDYLKMYIKYIGINYKLQQTAEYFNKDIYTTDRKINSVILQIGASVGFDASNYIEFLEEYGIKDDNRENFVSDLEKRHNKILEKLEKSPKKPAFDPELVPVAKSLAEFRKNQ